MRLAIYPHRRILHPFPIRSALLAAFLLAAAPGFAGGSVSYGEIEALVKDAGDFESLFAAGLRFGDSGEGMRLGRHFGELGGRRVGPYHFPARFPGDPAESFPYRVTLETEWTIVDAQGRSLGQEPPFRGEELGIEEVLRSVTLAPADGNADGGSGIIVIPGDPVEIGAVTEKNSEEAVARARRIYDEIHAADLQWTETSLPSDGPVASVLKRGRKDGKLRAVFASFGLHDHGGRNLEIYYAEDGTPAFAFYDSSYWRFVALEKTRDSVTERRFYFSEKGMARALEKTFEFDEGEDRAEVAAETDNRGLALHEQAARRVGRPLAALHTASDSQAVPLLAEFQRSQERLREEPASLDFADWSEIGIHRPPPVLPGGQSAEDAAFHMLLHLGMIPENQDEIPDEIYSESLAREQGKKGEWALAVVTLDGLKDDALAAERYLVELSKVDNEWLLNRIGHQVKSWPDRTRAPQQWRKAPGP